MCEYSYSNRKSPLKKHLWVSASESDPDNIFYVCMWNDCCQMLSTIEELDAHLDLHLECIFNKPRNSQQSLSCQIRGCEILIGSSDELLRHLKMHVFHAQKLFAGYSHIRHQRLDLKNCNFPGSSCLVYQGDALICEWYNCAKSFIDINKYMEHLTAHIDAENLSPYMCKWGGAVQECRMIFKSKNSLRLHIQHHSGDKACACPFCGMFFVNNTKLIEHMNRRQKGDFSCHFCQKYFNTARMLRMHCKRHLRNVKCTICATEFEKEFDLQRHVQSVHAKIHNFFCHICQRGFFQKSDLNRHSNLHTGIFQHECGICKKRFRWDKQLRYHAKTHSENYIESPYHCHLCDSTYRRGSALSKHLTASHNMPIPPGFSRFQYKRCADGRFRLQTRRWNGNEVLLEAKLQDSLQHAGENDDYKASVPSSGCIKNELQATSL